MEEVTDKIENFCGNIMNGRQKNYQKKDAGQTLQATAVCLKALCSYILLTKATQMPTIKLSAEQTQINYAVFS